VQAKEQVSKVSSREIEMHHLYHRAMNKPGRKEKKRLMKELQMLAETEEIFAKFLNISVEDIQVCRNGGEGEAC